MTTTSFSTGTMTLTRRVLMRSLGSGRWEDEAEGCSCSFDDDDGAHCGCATPPAREPDEDGCAASACPAPTPATTTKPRDTTTTEEVDGVQQQQLQLHPLLNDDDDDDDLWSDARLHAVARLWNFGEAKTADLFDMRERLRDVEYGNRRFLRPEVVVRFLRPAQRAGQNDYCEQKIRRTIQWRLDHRIDDLLDRRLYQPPAEFMLGFLPVAVLEGCDREGDPVFVMGSGRSNTQALIQKYGMEECGDFLRWVQEMVNFGPWRDEWQRQHGRPIRRLLHLEDVLNLNKIFHKKGFQLWVENCKNNATHYPETFKRSVFVGTPPIAVKLYHAVKYMFKKEDREKCVFASPARYTESMLEHVPLEILPSTWVKGGRGRAVDGFPWGFDGGADLVKEL